MKKLFLLATAMLAFVGCKDDGGVTDKPKADEISVSPDVKEFDNNGGTASVVVTSTGEWTLSTKESATYDWVTTDKTNGVDGDMVKFTVSPNETEDARFAYYVFTSGTATAEFKITSFAGEILKPSITVDETEIVKDYNQGSFEVVVKYSEGVDYRDIKAVIPESATWFKYAATLEGDEDGTAKMAFKYDALEGLDARETSFTISYDEVSIPMKMTQTPKPVIIPELPLYPIGLEAGTLSVKIAANVEYKAEVITDGESWLTDYVHGDGVDTWSYSAYDGARRDATIRFTEVAPAEGTEALVAEIKVVQSNALITTVVNMNDYRAVFKPETGNKDVLKIGKNITIEALVKVDSDISFTSINSIVGLEGRCLIRHSAGNRGKWEFVLAEDFGWGGSHDYREKVCEGGDLEINTWTHIAVTIDYESETITLYQNGEKIASLYTNQYAPHNIDFTEIYEHEGRQQEFALGYSYDNRRFFKGQMSEVRIWNRALTQDEIKAENHFYTVPTDSEGLVAYWKMNDGQGSIIKDYTSNGNDLVGQNFDGSIWNNADLVWEPVSLPE